MHVSDGAAGMPINHPRTHLISHRTDQQHHLLCCYIGGGGLFRVVPTHYHQRLWTCDGIKGTIYMVECGDKQGGGGGEIFKCCRRVGVVLDFYGSDCR